MSPIVAMEDAMDKWTHVVLGRWSYAPTDQVVLCLVTRTRIITAGGSRHHRDTGRMICKRGQRERWPCLWLYPDTLRPIEEISELIEALTPPATVG